METAPKFRLLWGFGQDVKFRAPTHGGSLPNVVGYILGTEGAHGRGRILEGFLVYVDITYVIPKARIKWVGNGVTGGEQGTFRPWSARLMSPLAGCML